ncbi:MAG: glycosyltransferase family 4 protein, partial [Myxococcota bacterium]
MPRGILLINERDPRNPLAGGAEIHIFEIFSRLAARGHEITLLAAHFRGGARREEVDGIDVRRLTNRYLFYGRVPLAARRLAREFDADVVVDVLNKLPFFSPWFVPRPCFAIVHHLFGDTAFAQVAAPVAAVTWLSERWIPAAYREVPLLAISPSTRDDLIERGLSGDRIWVVPPGVDGRVFTAPERAPEAPLIVWIGRLEPYKRAADLLEALPEIVRAVPEVRVAIIGAGGARDDLEKRSRELGLEARVEFTGFVSEEEKIDWLRRAAVTVNTSEKEGWGMTVIEGNACGAPSVSANVHGLRDAVRDGETGLLFACGDQGELARSIIRVLEEPGLREKLSTEGLRWAARFDWDRVADDALALIDRAIEGTSGPLALRASPFADAPEGGSGSGR